jgi:hypothetical protein
MAGAGADGRECSNYFYETSRPWGGGAPAKGNFEKLGDFTAAATETLRQMPEELRHRLGPGRGRGRIWDRWNWRAREALRRLVRVGITEW